MSFLNFRSIYYSYMMWDWGCYIAVIIQRDKGEAGSVQLLDDNWWTASWKDHAWRVMMRLFPTTATKRLKPGTDQLPLPFPFAIPSRMLLYSTTRVPSPCVLRNLMIRCCSSRKKYAFGFWSMKIINIGAVYNGYYVNRRLFHFYLFTHLFLL